MNARKQGLNLAARRVAATTPAALLIGLLPLLHGCPEELCIQSQESPSTEGNCEPGLGGMKCVQEIDNVALTSTYVRGVDFFSSTVEIDLDWCPDAECSDASTGRALHVIFILNEDEVPNADPVVFIANCQNRKVRETVENVQEIVIEEAPNLSDENTECGGNEVMHAFAKWEICPPGNFPE
jgi:hypothetical protein